MVEPVLRAIRLGMAGAGMLVEDSKGECNLGQHEVNFRYQEALRMADDHVVYRNGAKEIAFQHGKALTFMPKYDEREGNSCHIHLSLWEGESSLFPAGDGHGMSETFRQFIAGLVRHTRELTLLLAPNVNSYKRFVRGSFAPTALVWGHDNRTCALRVVGHGPGMRVESRVAGGDVNPYMAFAALLAAGLAGIDGGYELAPAWEGSGYDARDEPHVPSTLLEAARAVRRLGAGARGARRRGRRPLPECGDRRARRVRRRRDRLGAAALLRAPVSRPRIGISAYRTNARWTHWDLAATVIPQGYVEGVRLAGGVPILLPPTPEGAEDPGEVLDGLDGLVLTRRARPRPGAVRRRARGGHGRADARPPGARRLRAPVAARGAAARAPRARHLPRPAAHERRARRDARAGHRARRARSACRTGRSSARTGAIASRPRREPSRPRRSARPWTTSTPTTTRASRRWGTGWSSRGARHDGSIEAIEDPAQPFCMAVLWHPEEAHDTTGAPLFRALVQAAAERRDRLRAARFPRGTRGRPSSSSQSARCSSQMCWTMLQAGLSVERSGGDGVGRAAGLAPEQARAAAGAEAALAAGRALRAREPAQLSLRVDQRQSLAVDGRVGAARAVIAAAFDAVADEDAAQRPAQLVAHGAADAAAGRSRVGHAA